MEQVVVFHQIFQWLVQLENSVMEMETAFLSHKQFQTFQPLHQVHAHANLI
jgi:hypothetical protein